MLFAQNAPLRWALSDRAIFPRPRRNASPTIEGKGVTMTTAEGFSCPTFPCFLPGIVFVLHFHISYCIFSPLQIFHFFSIGMLRVRDILPSGKFQKFGNIYIPGIPGIYIYIFLFSLFFFHQNTGESRGNVVRQERPLQCLHYIFNGSSTYTAILL